MGGTRTPVPAAPDAFAAPLPAQGVLGYVILRPLMTAVGVVAQLIGVYGDGQLRFDRVYLYTTVVSNVSQVCMQTLTPKHVAARPRCASTASTCTPPSCPTSPRCVCKP